MFPDILIEPTPSKYYLTLYNNFIFKGFTSARIEYKILIWNPNLWVDFLNE